MADQWHVTRDEKKSGPFSSTALRRLAVSGKLLPSDQIWKEGMTKSVPASKVKGLFSDASSSAPSPSFSPTPSPPPQPISSPPPVSSLPSVPNQHSGETAQPASPAPGHSFLERAKAGAADLAAKAKAAAQLASKQAEKTKIVQLTLPSAYQALGKQVHSEGRLRERFGKEFLVIDDFMRQLESIKTAAAARSAPQGAGEKAKAIAVAAKAMAEAKTIQMRLSHAFGELGKAAFESDRERSGPDSFVHPISGFRARVEALENEIGNLELAHKGSWITPKRLLVAVAVLMLLGVIGSWNKGAGPSVTKDIGSQVAVDGESGDEAVGPSNSKDNGSQDDGDTGNERSTVSVARTDSPPAPKSLSEKDFAKVDYSLPDFSSLDYKKGPKGEKLETKDGGEKKLDWSDKNELIETPKGRKYTEEGYFDSSGVFVRHGLMTLWHDQAKVVKAAELQWFNNIHHGPTTVWDDKGHKLVSLSKVNGQGHGKRMVWDADGNKECEDYLFQGAFHGPRTVWHPNGTIKQKAFIWHGAFHGDVTEWHPNGEVAFKSTFKNGMYDGTFTRWHDNKQKAAKFTYSNTGRVGEGTIWYKSGTLRYTLHYSPTSKHDGKWTDWYDDGTKEAERHFENGRYVGVHTRWNKKGGIIWRYAFDANNTPLVHETTCHGFIAQVASLYGTTAGWDWHHIDTRRLQRFGQLGPGETYTDYKFTNTTHRPSEADFLQVCGKPDSILNADDSGVNQEWIYRCHDGTITICVTTYGRLPNPNVKTALKIYDTRADGLRSF